MSNISGTSGVLEQARSAAAEAGLDPARLAQDVGAKLKDAAEAQKNAGAEKVMGVARAIRSAAGNIEQDSPQVAQYVRSAASTLESLTRDFNDRSVDEMGQAVVDMARRSPGLFFAGSMLAGFALFRFLNAAQSGGQHSSSGRQDWSSRQMPRMGGQSGRSLGGQSGMSSEGSMGATTQNTGSSSGSHSTGASTHHTASPMSSPGGSSPSIGGSGAGGSYGGTSPSSGGYGGGAQGAREGSGQKGPSQGRGQS